MNCIECGEASQAEVCEACATENAMYAAYRESIDVPPLWSAVDRHIRHSTFNIQHSTFRIAAAAILGVLMLAAIALITRTPGKMQPRPVAIDAATHYRAAIAKVSSGSAQPLLPRLTAAISTAERAVARNPNDPVEVTHLVAAYDAKLQLLRTTADD
jgi:hypothetical protein